MQTSCAAETLLSRSDSLKAWAKQGTGWRTRQGVRAQVSRTKITEASEEVRIVIGQRPFSETRSGPNAVTF